MSVSIIPFESLIVMELISKLILSEYKDLDGTPRNRSNIRKNNSEVKLISARFDLTVLVSVSRLSASASSFSVVLNGLYSTYKILL